MPTTSNSAPQGEFGGSTCVGPQTGRTWFPIALGVLGGMVVWWLLCALETPSFYSLTVLVFNETSPKLLFAEPAYYCVHRTILLVLAAAGGSIGVLFSRWRKRRSVPFLLAVLMVIALFAALGFH